MTQEKKFTTKKSRSKNPMPDKALKSLAHSIYKTLKDEGCQHKEIIGVSSQLLGLVTMSLEADSNKK
jgi:hypothetical protein